MMRKYLINGKNFQLKEKYTLGELDELNEITKVLFPAASNVIQGNYTKGTLQKFVKIVLKSEEEVSEDFYSTIEADQFAEIYGDFFLQNLSLKKST